MTKFSNTVFFQLLLFLSYLLSSMMMMMCLLLLEDCQTNGNDDLFDILPKNIVWQEMLLLLSCIMMKIELQVEIFQGQLPLMQLSLTSKHTQSVVDLCGFRYATYYTHSTKQCVQLGQNQVVQSFDKLFQEVKKITDLYRNKKFQE